MSHERGFTAYTNWALEESNDWGGAEECVEMDITWGGGWNDNDCYVTRNWICKMPKGES